MKKYKILSATLCGILTFSTALISNYVDFNNVAYAEENSATLNYKNLADGEYTLNFATKRADNSGNLSMANDAMQKPAKLIVKNGEYKVQLTFTPLTFLGQHGYLGNLEYYSNNIKTQAEIVSYYSETEKDNFFDVYKSEFPERIAYPKTFSIPLDKTAITENGILVQKIGVYVPVMASINPASGRQDALTEFDFKTVNIVKLDETQNTNPPTNNNENDSQGENTGENTGNSTEENNNSSNSNPNDNKNDTNTAETTVNEKIVKLSIKDEAIIKPHVRLALEKNGKVVETNGNKELVVRYYSKQNWGADYIYDSGLNRVWYNYNTAEEKIELTPTVVEEGTHYQISEVRIPLNDNEQVYFYGNRQLNAITGTYQISYGLISLSNEAVNTVENKIVDKPEILRVSQLGSYEKDPSSGRLPFDFEKDGVLYSPYTAEKGTKFKLADGKYSVDINIKRLDFTNTKLRYVKYTLDGTEPTINSSSADFRSQNADKTLDSSLYRIIVNPLEEGILDKNGGNVTLKIKGFSADGSESSETETLILPFSKYYTDEVVRDISLNGNSYSAKITSSGNTILTENVNILAEEASQELKDEIKTKLNTLGITSFDVNKIAIVDENRAVYNLEYTNGWEEDKNPLLKLEISGFTQSKNKQVYLYKDGELKLVPSVVSKDKYSFNINNQSGYYIFVEKDTNDLLEENVTKLNAKVAEANEVLATALTSSAKVKLTNELKAVENTLSKKYLRKLPNILIHIENIEKYIEDVNNSKANTEYIKLKAQTFKELASNSILKDIISDEQFNKITELINSINSAGDNIDVLSNLTTSLENELNNLSYKYEVQTVDYMIEHYDRQDVKSMASGVFEPTAKLIYAPEKTYLEISLKAMNIFGTLAHLTDLDVFANGVDGDELNVHSISKFEEVDKSTNKIKLFDKKLLVELTKYPKSMYEVKLGNDGMPGAKPQAKLVIKSDIARKEATPINQLADNETKVKIESDILTSNNELVSEKLSSAELLKESKFKKALENKDVEIYNIEIIDKITGKEVDVNSNIKITLPIAEGKEVESVFYLAEDGQLTTISNFEVKGNTVEFITNHLSMYGIEYDKEIESTTPDNSGKDTNKPTVNSQNTDISDVKNLPDGEYTIGANIYNASVAGKLSMADGALVKPAKLIVKNGEYRVELTFKPLKIGTIEGYLGRLSYYTNGSVLEATVLSSYSGGEPKVVSYPINKNQINSSGILETRVRVFVPAMASINPDLGNQDALPTFNFNNLKLVKQYEEGSTEGTISFSGREAEDITQDNSGIAVGQSTGYRGGQLQRLSATGINSVSIESYYAVLMMLFATLLFTRKKN